MGTSHRELLMREVRVGRWDRTAARRKCLNPVSGEKRDIQPDKEDLEGRLGGGNSLHKASWYDVQCGWGSI